MTPHTLERRALAAARVLLARTYGYLPSPAQIAAEAGLSVAQARRLFPTPAHLTDRLIRVADRAATRAWPKASDSPEEDLFETVMLRLERFQTERQAFLSLAACCRKTPPLALVTYRADCAYMSAAFRRLQPKGERSPSPLQNLLLWTSFQHAFLRWQRDDSEDLHSTMAALNAAIETCKKAFFHTPF